MRQSRSGGGVRRLARLAGVVLLALPLAGVAVPATPVAAGGGTPVFFGVHIGTSGDTGSFLTLLDDRGLPQNAHQAVTIVTATWNPGGNPANPSWRSPGVLDFYGTWAVANMDGTTMPVGAAYDYFMLQSTNPYAFVHTVPSSGGTSLSTEIDNPATNGNPDLALFVAPLYVGGGREAGPVGVWYDSSTKKWAIFNEDLAPIPAGARFNVATARALGGGAVVHTATAANDLAGFATCIGEPTGATGPNAVLFVTPVWNPNGSQTGVIDSSPLMVGFDSPLDEWCIVNADGSAMPAGAAFNVVSMGGGKG